MHFPRAFAWTSYAANQHPWGDSKCHGLWHGDRGALADPKIGRMTRTMPNNSVPFSLPSGVVRILFLSLFLVSMTGCGVVEQPYRHMPEYGRTLHGGHWVPDIFPHDILDIHEQHDIDTNETWLRFSFSTETFDAKRHGYAPLAGARLDQLLVRKPSSKPWIKVWWKLEGLAGSDVYFGEHLDHRAYLVVTRDGTGYWWVG